MYQLDLCQLVALHEKATSEGWTLSRFYAVTDRLNKVAELRQTNAAVALEMKRLMARRRTLNAQADAVLDGADYAA